MSGKIRERYSAEVLDATRKREEGKTDWKRSAEMKDEDIDASDIPELHENLRDNAELVEPETNERITVRHKRGRLQAVTAHRGTHFAVGALDRADDRSVFVPVFPLLLLIVVVVWAPVESQAQVLPSASSLLYDFDGNVVCPTEDDAPEIDSREGIFSDFFRMNVDCSPGDGVFSSAGWTSGGEKVDTMYVGFSGEAPADAPFEFDEDSRISFLIKRSDAGPAEGELMYTRDNDVPGTIGSWTLDGIAPKELTFSLSQIPTAARIEFRFHAWDAESDEGIFTVDSVEMSFAIAVASEENSEQPNAFTVSEPFPNPFTTVATLPIDIGRPTAVRIQVVDVLGRSRGILFDGFLTRGRHRLRVDRENLPAGTYFLSVETADRQLVRKVTLQR